MTYIREISVLDFLNLGKGIAIGLMLSWICDFLKLSIVDLAQIVMALSAMVAVYAYKDQKEKDSLERKKEHKTSAIETISFFRKEILTASAQLAREINILDSSYLPTRLEKPLIPFDQARWEVDFVKERNKQIQLLKKDHERSSGEKGVVFSAQLILLNALEEFSLQVKHKELWEDEIYHSIINSFVHLVEDNLSGLFIYYPASSATFPGISFLYENWASRSDRRNFSERLKEIEAKEREYISSKSQLPVVLK